MAARGGLRGGARRQGVTLDLKDVCEIAADAARRHEVSAYELTRGQNAVVYGFDDWSVLATVDGAAPGSTAARTLPLCSVVAKIGRWTSKDSFEREVRIHGIAADAGLAPRIYYSHVTIVNGRMRGTIAMQRLTQPTYFRWLFWLSRQLRHMHERNALGWDIDKQALRLPIQKAWTRECKRVQTALFDAGIEHGDWHERNLVFDVPEVHNLAFKQDAEKDAKAIKHALMDAIAAGPASKRAQLYVIDFGSAHLFHSRIARFCAPICTGRHIADVDEEPPSAATIARSKSMSQAVDLDIELVQEERDNELDAALKTERLAERPLNRTASR